MINVELTRTNHNINDFFPFEIYKSLSKSLEHIHAQNIEGIDVNKKEQWIKWLNAHVDILPSLAVDPSKVKKIIEEVEAAIPKITYTQFEELSTKILALLPKTDDEENEYLHKIQNLALLGIEENSTLSNSVFEVKRRKIIELDKNGAFIPLATRRVFLNYYGDDTAVQHCLWTKKERDNYLEEIENCLEPYLTLKTKDNEEELY